MPPAKVEHLNEEDFRAKVAIEENEFQRLARSGQPLAIPWHRTPIRFGTGYHSSRQMTVDPWAQETPFDLAHLMLQAKVFRPEQGSTCSFVSKKTSRTEESNDHLTLSIGASVAPPLPIAKISVKGEFDQQVQENSDSDKQSIRSTCRAGCVELEVGPKLTREAMGFIKQYGLDAFKRRYGDYYVAGYRIGADTGLLLSSSSSSRKEVDNYKITATVEVLWFEVSTSWENEFEEFRSGRSIQLLAYDTLEGRNWKNQSSEGDQKRNMNNWLNGRPIAEVGSIRADAEEVIERSHNLVSRIGTVLQAHGVRSGSHLTFQQCEALVRAGVVIELQLRPMERLREVTHWRLYDNII